MFKNILGNISLFSVLLILISFVISYFVTSKVIKVVKYKGLMDNPNHRSSHYFKTPTLGGIAFYLTIMSSIFLINSFLKNSVSLNLILSLTVLFIVGLKDDLVILSIRSKLITQIFALSITLLHSDFHQINLYGFLGIESLSGFYAILFSSFTVVSVINGYNLIDGIDGLASMVGVVIFGFFSLIFYKTLNYYFYFLTIIIIASIVSFLRYNLSKTKKIFMGDTGSMILGFMIGVFVLKVLSLSQSELNNVFIKPSNILVIVIAILIVLFTDVIRVAVIRLMNHKKIFSPDRNHIHHVLVDSVGWSHIKASLVISLINILIILLIYFLNFYISTLSLTIVLITILVFFVLLLFKLNKNFYAKRKKAILKSKLKIKS